MITDFEIGETLYLPARPLYEIGAVPEDGEPYKCTYLGVKDNRCKVRTYGREIVFLPLKYIYKSIKDAAAYRETDEPPTSNR